MVLGIFKKKLPEAPTPPPELSAKKEESMVVNVSKKEKSLEDENKDLKAKLEELTKKVESGEVKPEPQPEEPKSDADIIQDQIKSKIEQFYSEYSVFSATASNETVKINLLWGILQELKKLNDKAK